MLQMPTTRRQKSEHGRRVTIHELCLQTHQITPSDVEVGKSTIRGAGKGLFSTVRIRKNAVIGEYTGTIVKWEHEFDEYWSMHTSRGHMIDASTSRRTCVVRFVNHNTGLLANCITRELYADGRVFLVAKRSIPAGKELFFNYGCDYPYHW
jgi:SET domain-containing protein